MKLSVSFKKSEEMVNIEEQKIKFYEKISAERSKKGKNTRMLMREHYNQTVSRMKPLENNMEPRVSSDSNLVRRFALLRVEVNGFVVKQDQRSTALPLVSLTQLVHQSTNHSISHPGVILCHQESPWGHPGISQGH